MPNALIHYFTGTGNSAHAARIVGESLSKYGYDIEIYHIKRPSLPPSKPADLHIIVSPVFALDLPYTVIRYLKKMANGNSTPTAVIVTHGMVSMQGGLHTGFEGAALETAMRILKRKNYAVFLAQPVGFPENITVVASSPPIKTCGEIIKAGDSKLLFFAELIRDQRVSIKKNDFIVNVGCSLAGLVFRKLGRWQVGKLYVADKDCTGCGYCARICPANTIKMENGRPRWGLSCDSCLGCFNKCPTNAVQISLIRIISLFFTTIVSLAFSWVTLGLFVKTYSIFQSPVYLALLPLVLIASYAFVFTFAIDEILVLLERLNLSKIFTWNFTKKFKRYSCSKFE